MRGRSPPLLLTPLLLVAVVGAASLGHAAFAPPDAPNPPSWIAEPPVGDLPAAATPFPIDADPRSALLFAAEAQGIPTEAVRAHVADRPPASPSAQAAYARLVSATRAANPDHPGIEGLPDVTGFPAFPPEVDAALGPLLDALHHAALLRSASLAHLDEEETDRLSALYSAYTASRDVADRGVLHAAVEADGLPPVDGARQVAAAYVLAAAGLEAAPALAAAAEAWTDPALHTGSAGAADCIEDPVGIVIVCGTGDDTIEGVWMLEIDLGGNDLHRTNAGGSGLGVLWPSGRELPAALAIDLYGDDHYAAPRQAQGVGATTPGVLLDLAGNDRYEVTEAGIAFAQGAGNLGGVGLLHDASGNDAYVAPLGRTGSRATWDTQGFGILGGIGILHDMTGRDRYQGGVMAQGVGDFQAFGLLADLGGRDTYEALYWSQAFADGLGAALLFDAGDDDRYRLVVDDAGALDGWRGQGVGIGGTALLLEAAGDDRYEALGEAQGWAVQGPAWKPIDDLLGILGVRPPGVGLLVDLGGYDAYSGSEGCDGCFWQGADSGFGADV